MMVDQAARMVDTNTGRSQNKGGRCRVYSILVKQKNDQRLTVNTVLILLVETGIKRTRLATYSV